MSTPETPQPVSSQIARWENMRKLVETWQSPYHWPSVEEFTARVAQIEKDLDERCPGWHEPWSGDLSRIADWVAAARPPETPRTWTLEAASFSGRGFDRVGKGRTFSGPTLGKGEYVEVIEKAPVDAERERLLDVIGRLLSDDASTAYSAGGDAVALLREYGRLGVEES